EDAAALEREAPRVLERLPRPPGSFAARGAQGLLALAPLPDRHQHRLRALLQHAARADGAAFLRARRLLRSWRLRHHARAAGDQRQLAPLPDHFGAARRRCRRAALRGRLRIRHDQAGRADLRHDLARHRRDGGGELAHVSLFLRRRRRRLEQSRGGREGAVRDHVWSADPDVLPDRRLGLPQHARHVRAEPDAARPHRQRGPRQPGSGRVRRVHSASRPRPHDDAGGVLRRDRGRAHRPELRDRYCRIAQRLHLGSRHHDGVRGRDRRLLRTDPRRGAHHRPADRGGGATAAWPVYFGLIFLLVVLYAPGGIAGILLEQMKLWRSGELRRLWPSYLLALVPAVILVVAVIFLVEMSYALVNSSQTGSSAVRFLGFGLDAGRALTWIAGAVALAICVALLRAAAKRIAGDRYVPPLPQGRT